MFFAFNRLPVYSQGSTGVLEVLSALKRKQDSVEAIKKKK